MVLPANKQLLESTDIDKRSMLQVHGLEAIMGNIPGDDEDTINNLTSDLEDLKTTVEELQINPPTNVDAESLQAVKAALQQASDATDEIEDQQEEGATSDTNSECVDRQSVETSYLEHGARRAGTECRRANREPERQQASGFVNARTRRRHPPLARANDQLSPIWPALYNRVVYAEPARPFDDRDLMHVRRCLRIAFAANHGDSTRSILECGPFRRRIHHHLRAAGHRLPVRPDGRRRLGNDQRPLDIRWKDHG